MAKRTLTLDIKAKGIEWVLLNASLRNVTIEESGQIVCPIEKTPTEAVAALKHLRDALDIPGLTCIAAIEGRGLFTRSIRVPFHDRRKIRQILPLELEATLPVGIDELALDFKTIGNNGAPTALAAAMPKAQIDKHLSLLRQAGLDPALITFAGLPAATLLAAGPHGNKISLLIDGDATHTMLFVVGDHQLLNLRSWMPSVVKGDPARRLQRAITHTLEALSQAMPELPDIEAVYMTPRGARHYPPDQVAAALEREVEIFDAARSAAGTLTGDLSGGHGQGALSLGLYEPLAEKGLNFFKHTFLLKQFYQQYRQEFVRLAILAAALATIFLVDVYTDIRRHQGRAQFFETEAANILKQTFPETRNFSAPLQQMIVKLRDARAAENTSPLGSQTAKIDILRAISQSLPPQLDIHVAQLVADTERIQISGTTGAFEAVNEAQEHLKKTGIFHKISIISANIDQKSGRVRFKLVADLAERHP